MAPRIGDSPIEPRLTARMNMLALDIEAALNEGAGGDLREWDYVLIVFPHPGHEGSVNYISNADRTTIVALLKQQLARLEGQPDVEGSA